MRPIRLEIEGLRSFRAREVIDFTGRDYIAVIGDTGAGKSSILEALTFALYGRTTFSGQGHQELMNASSTALRVLFEFEVGGEHWEVTRTLRRAGTGRVSTGVTALRRLDDNNEPIEAFDKARDVTAKIESVLGLDDEAFLRTVVLPQGQFSRLLVDDDQKLRASVLRQIWRTDELTDAGTLASEALSELGPLCGRVQQALEGLPDDPGAHLDVLDAEVARCKSLHDAARNRRNEASVAATAVVTAAAQKTRAEQLASMLSTWDGPAASVTAHDLENIDRESTATIADLQHLQAVARAALDAVPADEDGHTVAEIATFTTILESLPGLASQRDGAAGDAAAAQRDLDELHEQVDVAHGAAEKAAEVLKDLRIARVELERAAATATARLRPAGDAIKAARRAQSDVNDAELSVQSAEADLADVASKREDLAAAHADANAAHVAATIALEEARRAAAAAEAGHSLHGGDPCPVCDRELPKGWKPLAAPNLDAAREALKDASESLDSAKEATMTHEGSVRVAEGAVTSARQQLASTNKVALAAFEALVGHVGAAPGLESSDEELLADLVRATVVATSELEAHDSVIATADAAHSRLGNEHAAAEAAHRAKLAELRGATVRREEAALRYSEQLERLPKPLRPTDGDLPGQTSEAVAALEKRRGVLDEREAERQRQRTEIDALERRRSELDEARRSQVDEPASRLATAVLTHRSALDRASDELGASFSLPAVDSRATTGDLVALVSLVTRVTNELSAAAGVRAKEAEASSAAARLELARLAGDLELDAEEPDRILEASEALAEEAALNLRTARRDADTFRQLAPAIATLRVAGVALDERYLALADLSAALREGAFPKWLTLRRSRSLLVHASRLLSEMTAGRYAFADLDDDDSQWFVFDSDNGQPRSPASLSGGEKFVASLALALGMVEMMGRQGDRIESLFLDEGFGALDRANLDAAVEALGSVAATGRLVAVITHVAAVAEQIHHVLSVTREPTGTKTNWLSDSARSDLAEADVDASAGLLG